MATRQELFQQGEAVRQQLQHGAHGSTGGAVTGTVPGLRRLTTEAVFGVVWARPGLDLRYRGLCMRWRWPRTSWGSRAHCVPPRSLSCAVVLP